MRVNKIIAKMQMGQKAYGCTLGFPATAWVSPDLTSLTPRAHGNWPRRAVTSRAVSVALAPDAAPTTATTPPVSGEG